MIVVSVTTEIGIPEKFGIHSATQHFFTGFPREKKFKKKKYNNKLCENIPIFYRPSKLFLLKTKINKNVYVKVSTHLLSSEPIHKILFNKFCFLFLFLLSLS